MNKFPPLENITIHFAHTAYDFTGEFAARNTGIRHFQSHSQEDTVKRLGETDVLVLSGFWKDNFIEHAARLKYLQAISAGYNYIDTDALKARSIILCNAGGVNSNAVSEHAFALLLGLTRRIHLARDDQNKRFWRGMGSDMSSREEELPGKTMLIVGLGNIGSRTAKLARAFGMKTIGIKRNTQGFEELVDEIYPTNALCEHLPRADVVVLTCPLTDETANLMDANAFAVMKREAYFINVARGGCVDQSALVTALQEARLAGAGIDTFDIEPLPQSSALWGFDNVILTSHTGGETRAYEKNIVDQLLENLNRLAHGDDALINRIV
jgi:phosphoglycerate dehydrogenase-like enzyme